MTIPMQANTTCDIFRLAGGPPGTPAVVGVSIYLWADWVMSREHGDRESFDINWTHQMIVDYSTDIRDGYHGQCGINAGSEDYVYVPDQTGTPFQVSFVEVVQFGLSSVHKRVYLKRLTPNWPTNDL